MIFGLLSSWTRRSERGGLFTTSVGVHRGSLTGSQAERFPNRNGPIGPLPEKVIPPRFCTLRCIHGGTRIVSDSDLLSLPIVYFFRLITNHVVGVIGVARVKDVHLEDAENRSANLPSIEKD